MRSDFAIPFIIEWKVHRIHLWTRLKVNISSTESFMRVCHSDSSHGGGGSSPWLPTRSSSSTKPRRSLLQGRQKKFQLHHIRRPRGRSRNEGKTNKKGTIKPLHELFSAREADPWLLEQVNRHQMNAFRWDYLPRSRCLTFNKICRKVRLSFVHPFRRPRPPLSPKYFYETPWAA